ncbi:MAG: apolipoprotein N-acyltransferase [Lentisphaeria bacterium]|nr:apolipoprotein N-acyltransferase [Lentisphaeria bacterium]
MNPGVPVNEAPLVSKPCRALVAGVCMLGGMLYAASLPPWNWGFTILASLWPLFFVARRYPWRFRLLCGWLWGCAWAVFAFQFLREIFWLLPYLMMPVIAVWGGVYTLALGWFSRKLDRLPAPWREVLFTLTAAALFTVLEWTRSRLFVWNDFSVTMWRYPLAMRIAALTGRYGVTFLLAVGGAGLYALGRKKAGLPAAAVALALWLAALGYGGAKLSAPKTFRDPVTFRAALLQGDLPQMRRATLTEVNRAIAVYAELARRMLAERPDAVFFPECAVPVPLRGASYAAEAYRRSLSPLLGTPLLIGTLDFAPDGSGGMTNGALLIDREGRVAGKYDKFHRVPFGEYVPFREYLPEALIRVFDMGRDLVAGTDLHPLEVVPGVRVGCAICYEGVFSYVAAGFARNHANVLAALSNDVWYPASSEPEQHLANAVMRCVETGLPMIRCGNNGGSGVVTPEGRFTRYVGTPAPRPELLREAAAGVVEVTLERFPEPTGFVRFGDWFVHLCLLFLALEALRLAVRRP